MTITKQTVLAERMERQRLVKPVDTVEEYRSLFRDLQPVSPVSFTRPGDPPSLVHRSNFDDQTLTSDWRGKRKIIKGRFLHGTVGYVFSDELGLYANAFQQPLEMFNRGQELVYDTLLRVGPLTPRQIKEETGLLSKEIGPVLGRLQRAFLVFEDQVDTDWERAWYVFDQEWPEVDIGPDLWEQSALEVLRRFLRAHVFSTLEQLRDWSGWPMREIKRLLGSMESSRTVSFCRVDGLGEGWMLSEDISLRDDIPPRSTYMLHRADPLVRASAGELKRRFAGMEVLEYLLIEGDFLGAVCGHWRIGPYDVDDVFLELPPEERSARKEEIIQAVAWRYHPPAHNILRYDGKPLTIG